ncbi:MAG: prepilin-type N-terminal cleavage/methylation domain-containing protein [Phycisphaeraceae bacterium]
MSDRRQLGRRLQNRGISIMEMLIALAISAMLLTAVTVALNASFYAYASAAESASTHSSVRLVIQRAMRVIRTSAADKFDAYDPSGTVALEANTVVRTVGLEMENEVGRRVYIWWEANENYESALLGDLWYREDDMTAQPLLERVEARVHDEKAYVFALRFRQSAAGLLLSRATLDLSVQPGADATLSLESSQGKSAPVRLVASAMPRRNLD